MRKGVIRKLLEDALTIPRFAILSVMAKLIVPSYRLKWPQLNWWRNEQFSDYLRRFKELRGFNSDRRWMIYQLLRLVARIPGDTAECGVLHGGTSYLICCANARSQAGPKTHHIFDSFEGLSQPGGADGSHWQSGDLKCDIQHAQKALSRFGDVKFYPGWIPERFGEVADVRFSFVHIDVDLECPTRKSLEFFYPRMQPGGVIVCDDYGFTTCPGATQAVDQVLADKTEKMLMLPDGGGFFIKDMPVSSAFPL